MFRPFEHTPSHRSIALTRDIVEIVAILIAGIWAMYVFIYTDKIEPYQKPRAPILNASMTVEGARGALIAVRLSRSLENPAPVPLYVEGTISVVYGRKIEPSKMRAYAENGATGRLRFSVSRFEQVYSAITRSSYMLEPGETDANAQIVYIPRGEYDDLVFDRTEVFSRAPSTAKLTLTTNPFGIPSLQATGPCATSTNALCPQQITRETQLSLWNQSR